MAWKLPAKDSGRLSRESHGSGLAEYLSVV